MAARRNRFLLLRRKRRRHRRFSKLTRRILAINVIALAILVGGVLYLDQFRKSLIESRVAELTVEGEIIAGALAEAASIGSEAVKVEVEPAKQILARLVVPAEIRARLFDLDGDLLIDSRDLAVGNLIVVKKITPAGSLETFFKAVAATFHDAVDALASKETLQPYSEDLDQTSTDYPEVLVALEGETTSILRATENASAMVTVAVPVQRLHRVLGVLLLSKDTADIDRLVRRERVSILKIFGIALSVTLLLSLFLARTVARPITLLAEAADRVRPGLGRQVRIPEFRRRKDEIGELSRSLKDMTQALFDQIDAVESFAADVSHELKNPITSIRSAIETLSRATDPDKQRQLIAIVEADVARLNRLVTEISAASRLEAQMSRAQMEAVDLGKLVANLAEAYTATAKRGATKIKIDLPVFASRQPLMVNGLHGPLGQVLRNLLDNAISFSPSGRPVTVRLRRLDSAAELAVEDEGPGVPPDKLEEIFKRFYSERPAGEAFGRHSGLGLHISKRIIEAHDGVIFAENRHDEAGNVVGARFVVRLPLA